MKNFKVWLESTNQQDLKSLAWHVLSHEKVGPFDQRLGEKWHGDLINYLRKIGWDEYADNLELYKPTQKDVEYANSTIPNPLRSTLSSVTGYNPDLKDNYRRSSQMYHNICNEIINKIEKIIEDKDWLLNAIKDQY